MSPVQKVALGELVAPVTSWTPERDDPDGAFTYIDLSAVNQDAKAITGARQLACADAPSRARQLIRTDDVLVSTVRPNLNAVARVPQELAGATASTGFCVVRPRPDKLHGGYLLHWVRSPRFVGEMVRLATGASYPAVSDRIVLDSKLPLPPLPEQRRIAEILDKADALRAKRRATLAQLDTLTQSIFLDMFGDPATNPKGWPCAELKDVVEKVQIGPFGSLLHHEDYITGGVPLVNPMHIQNGEIAVSGTDSISERKYKTLRPYHLRPGDVVMGRRGEMGRCAVVEFAHEKLVCGTGSLFIRPDDVRSTSRYLFSLLSSLSTRRRLDRLSQGQTLPNLNSRIVESLEIPVPSIALQRAFAAQVERLRALRAQYCASLADFGSAFNSLQHRAFHGEL